MPKSIPSVGDPDWGTPLNEHLGQLMNPTTGGFNRWFGAANRPWADGDTSHSDEENYTGFNELTGIFERWDVANNLWVVMQPVEQNPLEIVGPGQIELKADNTQNTDRYLFLENDLGNLGTIVSDNDVIEINDGGVLKLYFVQDVISANKVRVIAEQPVYEAITGGTVTIQLNHNGNGNEIQVTTGQTNYFNIGDQYLATDTGSTIMEQISTNEYYQQTFSAILTPRDLISVYRAPQGLKNYTIYKPTIKYIDANQEVAFSSDRYGVNRVGLIQAQAADKAANQAMSGILLDNYLVMHPGNTVNRVMTDYKTDFAIETGVNSSLYKAMTANQFRMRRVEATQIYSGASSNPADWNGSFDGEVSNVFVETSHGPNLQDGTTTITTPKMIGLRLDCQVRGGKISNYTAISTDPTDVITSAGAIAPDEVWGVVERTGGNLGQFSRNFFAGYTQIGSSAGQESNGAPTHSSVTSKLKVYGDVEVLAVAGTGSVSNGDINYAGALNNTSDERVKDNIKSIASTEALEMVKNIQGKSYNLKGDEAKLNRFGVIAQEIEQVLPELVKEGSDGMKSVNYIGIIPLLVEAIKEQQKQIDELKSLLEK